MTWNLTTGDCLDILPTLPAESIEACITDPPYGWSFMQSNWDHGVPGEAYWKEVLRVLKPGGWLLAFGGPRTHHRLMVAIEDAGFELRDCFCWLFGSGFPKALNISKAIDKAAGAKREIIGTNTAFSARANKKRKGENPFDNSIKDGAFSHPETVGQITAPATTEAKLWDGWASALKPAHEPIILAMKPLDGTFANNALTHGVAGLNIDGCRIPLNGEPSTSEARRKSTFGGRTGETAKTSNTLGRLNRRGDPAIYATNHGGEKGRWPANVILDEEAGKLLDEQSDRTSRFFYCAKCSRTERTHKGAIANNHPTVKPLALMRWLCRLVSTPTGGTILDPFAGSGSTGVAALQEGLSFIGIELSPEYAEIARARLEDTTAKAQPEQLGLDLDQP